MQRNFLFVFTRPFLLSLVLASVINAFKATHKGYLSSQKRTICRSVPDTVSAVDGMSDKMSESPLSVMMEQVSKPYESFIIDQWGVLHDGKTPYPGVVDCLKNLKSLGKRLILLSNSSKRKESSFKGLNKVGIDSLLFDDIVTSGELAWNAINERRFDFSLAGKIPGSDNNGHNGNYKKLKVFVIGNNDDDVDYITSCNCIASPPEEADFILARGTFCFLTGSDSERSPEHSSEKLPQNSTQECADHSAGKISYKNAEDLVLSVDPWLERGVARGVPMLVSNPDFHRPGSGAPMPGLIGKKYSALGGTVQYIGKPYGTVYDACLSVLTVRSNDGETNANGDDDNNSNNNSNDSSSDKSNSNDKDNIDHIDKSKICCIGDSLDHDIEGARRAGIDSIWTANGVHSGEMGTMEGSVDLAGKNILQGMFRKYGITPTHTIASFHW